MVLEKGQIFGEESMLMTDASTGDSLLTSHYTVRCHSLNGLVGKISI